MACSIRVLVLGVSSEPLFKGRNANCTQRGAPQTTVLGHTPTLSHKMMYLSADPVRRVQQNLSLERSERSGPSGKSPQAGPKICNFPQIRHSMCVSALKKGLKRPPCKSVCECVCVVSHVFLGPKRKMLKSVCECVAGGSPQPFFKG